jgi:cytochrome P450
MYPSVPQILTREALFDHKLGEINIKKGTYIAVDIISHHYNEKVFENPL